VSKENVEPTTPDLLERVQQALDAGNRGDLEEMVSFFAPDAVWEFRGLGTSFQGIPAIRGLLEDWFGTYEGLQIEAEEILDLGHGITFAVCTQKGHPRGSTAQAQFRFAQLSTWVDGHIVRLTGYNDIEEARAGAEHLAEERR
jgi:ketosteroid isomerase-like protein